MIIATLEDYYEIAKVIHESPPSAPVIATGADGFVAEGVDFTRLGCPRMRATLQFRHP
jgi:hypothetical protein